MRWIIHWILSAVALMVVAYLVPGFVVRGFGSALLAVAVIALVNATLGAFLKLITLPLTILTLGIFWFVVNALMLMVASRIVPGFIISGFLPAFLGALVLSLLNIVVRALTPKREQL